MITRAGAAVLLVFVAGLSAQSGQNAGSAPEEVIRVDAVITDAQNRPIRDLKAADIEVVDSGDSRSVEAASPVTGSNGRLIALFLDDFHVDAGEGTNRARAALHAFADRDLRPDDLVAVMKPLDPLNAIQLSSDRAALHAAIDAFDGRKGDYEPRSPFEKQFISRAPVSAEASRNQVTTSALQALTLRIGEAREGRKAVVIVSDGFAPSLPRASDRLLGAARTIVYAANRFSVALYPLSPLRVSAPDADAEPGRAAMLQMIAEQTGGEATLNQADLNGGLQRMLRDLDDYYIISYRARRTGDGRFHPVALRVKRPGVQVRMRSGYWAANAALLRASATSSFPSFTARPPHASQYIRPWIGTAQGPDGLTRVSIVWESGSPPPRNQRVDSVAVKAMAEDGRVVFEDRLRARQRAVFDTKPGTISLEMELESVGGTTIDTDVRGVRVPDLRATKPTFATAQVMRTRSARAFAEISGDPDAVPTPAREFSRAERLLVRVPVYGPPGSMPEVFAQLMNRAGAPMRRLARIDSLVTPGIVQFDLPLASLAPDEYRVEFVATAGGQEAREVVLFRVVN